FTQIQGCKDASGVTFYLNSLFSSPPSLSPSLSLSLSLSLFYALVVRSSSRKTAYLSLLTECNRTWVSFGNAPSSPPNCFLNSLFSSCPDWTDLPLLPSLCPCL